MATYVATAPDDAARSRAPVAAARHYARRDLDLLERGRGAGTRRRRRAGIGTQLHEQPNLWLQLGKRLSVEATKGTP